MYSISEVGGALYSVVFGLLVGLLEEVYILIGFVWHLVWGFGIVEEYGFFARDLRIYSFCYLEIKETRLVWT